LSKTSFEDPPKVRETEQHPTPSPNRIENVSFATLVSHL
jgi:hypothetical protein